MAAVNYYGMSAIFWMLVAIFLWLVTHFEKPWDRSPEPPLTAKEKLKNLGFRIGVIGGVTLFFTAGSWMDYIGVTKVPLWCAYILVALVGVVWIVSTVIAFARDPRFFIPAPPKPQIERSEQIANIVWAILVGTFRVAIFFVVTGVLAGVVLYATHPTESPPPKPYIAAPDPATAVG